MNIYNTTHFSVHFSVHSTCYFLLDWNHVNELVYTDLD